MYGSMPANGMSNQIPNAIANQMPNASMPTSMSQQYGHHGLVPTGPVSPLRHNLDQGQHQHPVQGYNNGQVPNIHQNMHSHETHQQQHPVQGYTTPQHPSISSIDSQQHSYSSSQLSNGPPAMPVAPPNQPLNGSSNQAPSVVHKIDPVGFRRGNFVYSIVVEQQPVRARMCGFGDKDRRPITPPPCVRLCVKYHDTGGEVDIK
jgi:Velvet factor